MTDDYCMQRGQTIYSSVLPFFSFSAFSSIEQERKMNTESHTDYYWSIWMSIDVAILFFALSSFSLLSYEIYITEISDSYFFFCWSWFCSCIIALEIKFHILISLKKNGRLWFGQTLEKKEINNQTWCKQILSGTLIETLLFMIY
jgi:hypothetical protein